MSGPTGEVEVKLVTGGEETASSIEEESAPLARRMTLVLGESPTCDCEKCRLVRQARALLRRLGEE